MTLLKIRPYESVRAEAKLEFEPLVQPLSDPFESFQLEKLRFITAAIAKQFSSRTISSLRD